VPEELVHQHLYFVVFNGAGSQYIASEAAADYQVRLYTTSNTFI